MKEQLTALYKLQEVDVQIGTANAGLESLSGARNAKQQSNAAKQALEKAEQTLTDTQLELKQNELNLKSIDEKRASTEKRLYSGAIMSVKEQTSLEKEIEHLKSQQGELDGRVLELYDTVESLREKVKSAHALADECEKRLAKAISAESAKRKELQSELVELQSQREKMALEVTDKQLFSRYEAIRKRSGNTGIAKIIEGKCGGCHVTVTTFTIRQLFEDKGVEYCENCGRILMLDVE